MDFRRAYHRYTPQSVKAIVRRVRGRNSTAEPSEPRSGSSSSGFEAVVRKLYERPDGVPVHPMRRTWLKYALDTNARGEEVARTVSKFTALKGKRHLDIGSAYGGTVIAFADRGATATGVEISPRFFDLGLINAGDHPHLSVELLVGDILSEEVHSGLGKFDIITCEHVIEHVSDVTEFLRVLARLMADDGISHLLIPNPFNPKEVEGDGHYGLFGLTLLDRVTAESYFQSTGWNEEYGVGEYCFTYRDHESMFREAGLCLEQIHPPDDFRQSEALEQIATRIMQLTGTLESKVSSGEITADFARPIAAALEDYTRRFERAHKRFLDSSGGLRKSLGRELLVQYGQEAWYVIAYKEIGPAIGVVGEPTV